MICGSHCTREFHRYNQTVPAAGFRSASVAENRILLSAAAYSGCCNMGSAQTLMSH